MKNLLGTAAIIGAGLLALPGIASASSVSGAATGQSSVQKSLTEVDFKPFRHCHGPRWDRRCHSGGVLFFRDRDRRDWRDRDRYRDRDRDRPRRYRDFD